MVDAQRGLPYTPTLTITDNNGSPVTSGVTGTLSLYGPGSTVALASGPLSHQGGGAWGYTCAGSLLVAAGTYTYVVPSLVTPGGTFAEQGGTFTVGVVPPWMRTLRQLVTDLTIALQDGFTGTSDGDAPGVDSLKDSRLQDDTAGSAEYRGSELLLLEPATGAASLHKVTTFFGTSGLVQFTPGAAGIPLAGTDYLLSFLNGRGYTHAQKLAALRSVVDGARVRLPTSDQVTLTGSATDYRYAIPDDWISVIRAVRYRNAGSGPAGAWRWIRPALIDVDRDARAVLIRAPLAGQQLWIAGSYAPSLPGSLNGLVPLPGDAVVDAAHARLTLQRGGAGLPQLGAMLAQPRYRGLTLGNRWRANEVNLL